MTITSGELNKLDTAMQRYFNAVYRASHAAYKQGFDLDARRAVISDKDLYALRDTVTAAADPVNQTVFTFDTYAAKQVEKIAREAATKDTRAGVPVEDGLRKAADGFKKKASLDIIAQLDDSNAGARGVPGQTSHLALMKEARAGNMLAQNYDTPASKASGVSIIPEAKAATVKAAAATASMSTPDGQKLGGLVLAIQEFEGACVSYGSSAQKASVFNILRANEPAISDPSKFLQVFVNLDKAATDKTGEFGGKDYALARDILARARVIQHEQDKGGETFKAHTDHASLSALYAKLTGDFRPIAQKKGYVADGQPIAKAAAGGDIPAAPSGDDEASYGAYKGQTYAASDAKRGSVREAQLYLEALGLTTGNGNSARFGAGQSDKSAMDGIVGPKTDAAIKQFQKDNGLEQTGALDEATMAKLKEAAGPKLQAATPAPEVTAGTTDTPAPAPEAKATTVLAARFAKEIAAVTEATTTPTNFYNDPKTRAGLKEESEGVFEDPNKAPGFIQKKVDAGIKEKALENLREKGINLTAAQESELTVNRGIIYSPVLKQIETALGLAVVDGKLDANLSAILDIPELRKVVAEAVGNNTLGQLAAAAPGGKASEGPAKA